MIWVLVFVLSVFITAGLVLSWAAVAVPLAAIILLQAFLIGSEFILRRFAEYPKGPTIALSLLLVALAAVFKAVS
jgi:hypothetical protein